MQPKLKTSRGGIRLPMGIGGSDTLHTAPLPESATLYLDCPAGVIARPSVAVGDTVRRFSLLASPAGELGTPVYSPICGRVSRIGEDGTRPTVTVTTDGGDAAERIAPVSRPLGELSADEIIALARGAGIICRSGLPMWKNIELSVGAAHTLIISALTSDPLDRSLLTLAACKPEALLCGVKIIQRALGIRRAAVVVPERGTAALSRLRAAAAADGSAELFRFITATEIYPMHEDAQLIYALAGPAMPDGAHPSDIGYAVFDAASCAALFETYATGAPCTRSAVTVTGDCVRSSATVLAATGTPIAYRSRRTYDRQHSCRRRCARAVHGTCSVFGQARDARGDRLHPLRQMCFGLPAQSCAAVSVDVRRAKSLRPLRKISSRVVQRLRLLRLCMSVGHPAYREYYLRPRPYEKQRRRYKDRHRTRRCG